MSKLHCDIKYMYTTRTGHRFILVIADEVTNYLVTIAFYRRTSHKVGEALINYVFCKYGPPSYLKFDEDLAFLSKVM